MAPGVHGSYYLFSSQQIPPKLQLPTSTPYNYNQRMIIYLTKMLAWLWRLATGDLLTLSVCEGGKGMVANASQR